MEQNLFLKLSNGTEKNIEYVSFNKYALMRENLFFEKDKLFHKINNIEAIFDTFRILKSEIIESELFYNLS